MRSRDANHSPTDTRKASAIVYKCVVRSILQHGDKYMLQPHRHLWADCLENVGASMSHKLMGLHGLLQG
jgi:hypothetical protein